MFIGFLVARVHSLSEGSTLYFKDIQGDISVLEDVTIKGIIHDRYHVQEFTIKNNKINKKIRAFTHYKQWKEQSVSETYKVWTNVRGNVVSFELTMPFGTTRRYRSGIEQGVVEGREYPYGMFDGNNFTVIDDVMYFTFNTPIGYKGVNGIFKAEGPFYRDANNKLRPTSINRIVTLDLDEANNKMSILGITSMNNTLYLFTLMENILTVTTYDPITAEIINKASAEIDWKRYHNGVIMLHSLILHEQDDYLHLELMFGRNERTIITFDMRDGGVELKNLSEPRIDYNNLIGYTDELDNIYYLEDKLFVFIKMDYRYGDSNYFQYNILVYKDDALLYQGELVTDIEEDFTVDRLKREALYTRGNRRYSGYEYREIDKIVVTKSN